MKIKKITSIIISSCLLFSTTASAFFSDTKEHLYEQSINFIQEKGIVNGYSDGTFKPDKTLNRAELLKIVLKKNYTDFSDQNCFPDVRSGNWYTKYVCKGKELGIVKGYGDGTFKPEKDVNFTEALKIIMLAYNLPFEESVVGNWYDKAILQASKINIIPSGLLNYEQKIGRGQMADMLARLLQYKETVPNVPKKYLTLISVNSGAESKYESNGWEKTLKFKENDYIQIFEVAIWNNGQLNNPKKVSVYKFDRTFDPFKPEYSEGGTAWVNYRESFNILNMDVPQPSSVVYLDAFKIIFKTIIENQPAEHYGIRYGGHGSGEGSIFGAEIIKSDAEVLFSYINNLIGKKLDFLDWSTNCDMGTYTVIASQYPYADYILSSDLLRGGFAMDWVNDYYRLKPEAVLNNFFSPSKSIRQALIDMVDSERRIWETEITKNDMITKRIKQSLSIYDTSKFEELNASANLDQMQSGDVLDYIRENYPSQEQKFYDFRFHYIDNKDFFPWDVDSNGFVKT